MKRMNIKRDTAIVANYKREINLQTKFVRNAKAYTRKYKHKLYAFN